MPRSDVSRRRRQAVSVRWRCCTSLRYNRRPHPRQYGSRACGPPGIGRAALHPKEYGVTCSIASAEVDDGGQMPTVVPGCRRCRRPHPRCPRTSRSEHEVGYGPGDRRKPVVQGARGPKRRAGGGSREMSRDSRSVVSGRALRVRGDPQGSMSFGAYVSGLAASGPVAPRCSVACPGRDVAGRHRRR
jgi:hypothetical protein